MRLCVRTFSLSSPRLTDIWLKTLLIAQFYGANGYGIHYAVFGQNRAVEPLLPGTVHRMKSRPFGITYGAYDDAQPPARLSW